MLKQEGYDLMGAAFEVYNEFGCGMAEEIYQAALEVGLQGIGARKQVGHLINFGKKGELEWKRFVVDDRHVRMK